MDSDRSGSLSWRLSMPEARGLSATCPEEESELEDGGSKSPARRLLISSRAVPGEEVQELRDGTGGAWFSKGMKSPKHLLISLGAGLSLLVLAFVAAKVAQNQDKSEHARLAKGDASLLYEAESGCEICPVGDCDRDKVSGACKWYPPPEDKAGAFHCQVTDCILAPGKGNGISGCWTYKHLNYYSVAVRDAPCQRSEDVDAEDLETGDEQVLKEKKEEEEEEVVQEIIDPHDPRLAAYWDIGNCGPGKDDQNSDWCGGLVYKPDCQRVVPVGDGICLSGFAHLTSISWDDDKKTYWKWVDDCSYEYYAQYTCLPVTTTTTTYTTTTKTSTTTTTTTTITTTVVTTTRKEEKMMLKNQAAYEDDLIEDVKTVNTPPPQVPISPFAMTTTTTIPRSELVEEEIEEHEKEEREHKTQREEEEEKRRKREEEEKKKEPEEYKVYTWTEESGVGPGTEDCTDRFRPPQAPALATDHNGVQLPDVCFRKPGPHYVQIIGDWGGILGPNGPVPANQRNKAEFVDGVDDVAQLRVAAQMRVRAEHRSPDYLLNVGDNFYWSGINLKCGIAPAYQVISTGQFEWAYEHIYVGSGLEGKAWLGVLGNHDYGGYRFDRGWDQLIAYTWGIGNRWIIPAQYWRQIVRYPGFSVDYFFLDTNHFMAQPASADSEHNICSDVHVTKNTTCGKLGLDGVEGCPGWFEDTWKKQQKWIHHSLNESTADWQIVVTHFPPGWDIPFWKELCYKYGLDLIVTGHQHDQELFGPNHPGNWLAPSAYVISGGGGGITSENPPSADGNDDQYGFMELTLSKEVIEIQTISHGGFLRWSDFLTPRGREVEFTSNTKKKHKHHHSDSQDRSLNYGGIFGNLRFWDR